MSTDNRTELNDCDVATGWDGDGPTPAVISTTGQYYQGTGAIESQHSNTDEHMWTTEDTLNGGTFSIDLSDATLYMQVKDNLIDTLANGGMQYVVGDGTNRIGYDVGGNDSVGLPLPTFFNCYKLDLSNKPASFATYAGAEANLTETTITEVGTGTLHLAKAVGNVNNIFVDYFSYIANGSAALTINGGTVGTPETMVDVVGDDVTNGWGLISNPLGSQYLFFGPTEWGDAGTADSYFTGSDEQWFWIGGVVGATHFDFNLTANSTGTNSFVLSNVVIVGLDVRSAFDLAPANHDIMKLDNVTFTDIGAITFPTQSIGNKWANTCIFNNCDQVNPSTIDMDGCVFNGTTDANGALLVAATTDNMDGLIFNSDGTGHAIYITASGTYDFTNFAYTGYGADDTTDAVVYNNSGGLVTINVLGGDSPTVRNGAGASTVVNNPKTFTVTGIQTNSEVRIFNATTRDEIAGTENETGGVTRVTIVGGGSAYTVSDVLTVVGGTGTAATLTVTSIDGGGGITGVSITNPGDYSVNPTNPVSVTGGTGTGATFRLTITGSFSYQYNYAADIDIYLVVFHLDYKDLRIIDLTLGNDDQSILVQQQTDRVYSNP